MFPYWALLAAFALGAIINPPQPQGRISPTLVLPLIAAIIMIGFRYHVGGDWQHYQVLYRRIAFMDLGQALTVSNSDPGYGLVNWIGQQIGLRIWFVNLVCGSILVWGLARLARQQPNPWLFMVTATSYGLIVVGMGYTRQSVAIGLCAAALASFRDHGLKRAAPFVVLAALFHKSAIVMLPLIALADGKRPLVNAIYGAGLVAALSYVLLAPSSDRLFDTYIGLQISSQGAGVRVAMTVVPAVCFLFLKTRLGLEGRERTLYRNLALAGLVAALSLALTPSSTVVDRLNLYLIPFQSVVWSRIPGSEPGRRAETTTRIVVVAYAACVLFVWLNYAANSMYWLPYRFYPLT